MNTVTAIQYRYKYKLYIEKPLGPFISIVVRKFIAPNIELIPAKCRLKIIASIGVSRAERGGYIVQPDPTLPCRRPQAKHIEAGKSIQKEKLLRRGQAISGTLIMKGISQLPKPPISIGITKKKIIIIPWPVTTTLYACLSMPLVPNLVSSIRSILLKLDPVIPKLKPVRRYKDPMSL
jgi:hypothetical protein